MVSVPLTQHHHRTLLLILCYFSNTSGTGRRKTSLPPHNEIIKPYMVKVGGGGGYTFPHLPRHSMTAVQPTSQSRQMVMWRETDPVTPSLYAYITSEPKKECDHVARNGSSDTITLCVHYIRTKDRDYVARKGTSDIIFLFISQTLTPWGWRSGVLLLLQPSW
jgi:hypothetical protein